MAATIAQILRLSDKRKTVVIGACPVKKAASPPMIDPPSKTPSAMKKLLINAGTKASFMYHHPFWLDILLLYLYGKRGGNMIACENQSGRT
ncbi:hypothetical protein ACIQZM_16205 [Peribacillus sp. NPDC097206]|uniref:hypothetical protein n=1 Tax=unclassified Peribacillus TaxID=2675266 RepID=UPI003826573B